MNKSTIKWFLFGVSFVLIGIQVINCISNGILALSGWFSSWVNVKQCTNNANAVRERSKADMYCNDIPEVSYREDDNGEDNYL